MTSSPKEEERVIDCKVDPSEENSTGSNEQSNTSGSTGIAAQGQQSPTGETSNTTVSASSSNVTAPENDNQNDDQDQQNIVKHDPSSTEDDESKATWETGILDASSFITIKLLVSNNMAGSIIGRSGETISELQEQSSARVKLGQSGDYYPGTSERACLVHGSLDNVKKAATLILSKLYDVQTQQVESQLQAENSNDTAEDSSTNLSFSVRLLIPTASCGMLIGRNGTSIKKIKDTSCVNSIRLSSKEHSNANMHYSSESMAISATSERILTVAGNELNSCISCVFLILEGFARHPDVCRYVNNTTSYSKVTSSYNDHYGSGYHARSSSTGGVASIPQNRGPRTGSAYLSGHHQRMQRPASDDRRRHQQQTYRNPSGGGVKLGNTPHSQPSSPYASSPSGSRHSQNIDPQQQLQTVKISISDTMVGAILGKRGQTLTHLEDQSGTKIKISQRGEFIPGTQNRIVTISGPNSESIASAKSLIRQQLARNTHHDRIASTSTPENES